MVSAVLYGETLGEFVAVESDALDGAGANTTDLTDGLMDNFSGDATGVSEEDMLGDAEGRKDVGSPDGGPVGCLDDGKVGDKVG